MENGQQHDASVQKPKSQAKAPGGPGSKPTWSPASKSGVGCAISPRSRLWFTLGRGIVNEVYHPWMDQAAIRDFGLVVTGPNGFFSEERSDCSSSTQTIVPGIPAYRVENRCTKGRYQITKEILADPRRDVLLQRIRIIPLIGSLADYRLFALISPRLGDQGTENTAWTGHYKKWPMLFARCGDEAMALASSIPWLKRSVGFVGVSDAWQDLKQHGGMTWEYELAESGHVAVAGEIDIHNCAGDFVLALGLDRAPEAAALNAVLSLGCPFESARDRYVQEWRDWQKAVAALDDGASSELVKTNEGQRRRPDQSRPRVTEDGSSEPANLYRAGMMVLRVHRSQQFAGAGVASLSVPWGEVRDDDDLGGYHLVWPRDLVEASCGLLAGGALEEAQDAVNYLRATQKPGGGWAQNMWLDGSPHAEGEQMDEAALPILLVDLARRESAIDAASVYSFWEMIRTAAAFIIRSGPATGQDRWENAPGLSPYTLATEIAALLVAARMADEFKERELANYFRETADLWNDLIEPWTYVTGTALAQRLGVEGYYIRIAPSPGIQDILREGKECKVGGLPPAEVISPDALALVRFGLRAADDPRILNTVKVIDEINGVETPAGPAWHRYNGGHYGESDSGEPFQPHGQHTGHGRAWPLLTGERGHYELMAGNAEKARQMLQTMAGFASQVGFLPEQVWDSDDLPDRALYRGRPTGSAMPLAWAHAEYIRLLRSMRDGRVFDRPTDTVERYIDRKTRSGLALWRFDHQATSFAAGRRLRIELLSPAVIHFSTDHWVNPQDIQTRDTGIGLHVADLPTSEMEPGEKLSFTFRWREDNRWEGKDFQLDVEAPAPESPKQASASWRADVQRSMAGSRR
ncbi:MAG: glycoside hydrolase family 15 protein [Tepidisphaeraceae bacterium]|jgi:glucoamylase